MSSEERVEPRPEDRRRTIRELAVFFGLAFALTWGLGAALILARPRLESVVGPLGPINHSWIFYLAVSAPTLSAIACSLMFGGIAGLKTLALRFVRPFNPLWLIIAILILPATVAVFALATRAFGWNGIDLHALAVGAPLLALTTTALIVDPGGLGEETGWRGYALPRLVTLVRPAWAGLGLGLVWGLWHLPAFFVSDLAQSKFGLGWFLLGSIALSMVMTWLFVRANGNVVVAGVIPHLLSNLLFDAHVFLRDAIQQETIAGGLVAVLLVIVFGPDLTRRRKARP